MEDAEFGYKCVLMSACRQPGGLARLSGMWVRVLAAAGRQAEACRGSHTCLTASFCVLQHLQAAVGRQARQKRSAARTETKMPGGRPRGWAENPEAAVLLAAAPEAAPTGIPLWWSQTIDGSEQQSCP